ncbi:hypothetical protein B0T16DRAFT_117327 [Cercophora newfieldiana]|uniref:Zn(2)-C6 fungal-type domain-containing protein n=1 Tax=Cercophora newfieldiana TaxID=92897 RepID=A0AA39YCN9_9PEZI|nr:hypothetical protein B0T16DRAFT_117327 [Cercophora newfieldiana]
MSTKLLMPGSSQPELHQKSRLRKAHRKSRRGCANCKIRKVKCDESKPRCQKCISFGIGCSYEAGVPEMHLDFAGSFRVDLSGSGSQSFAFSVNPSLPRLLPDFPTYLPVAGGKKDQLYQLSPIDKRRLQGFKERGVLTVGPREAAMVFQSHALEFSVNSPFLTHLILALTLLFETHQTKPDRKKTAALAFHFYHGVSLFNTKLSQPVSPLDKDILWCAASLTAAAAFADVKATEASETWILSPSPVADLEWLRMTGGKKAVYDLTNPTRPESVFNASCDHFLDPTAHVGEEILNLPPKFIDLYNLDEFSTSESNPYHNAATVLARVMPLECNRKTITKFLTFVGFPDPGFLRLLEQRDPRALLLLNYWYAKTLTTEHWWIYRRGIIEGPALCTFLEDAFGNDPELLGLLDFPKAAFARALSQRSE